MSNRICFLSAPIGEDNSPERGHYLVLCEILRTACETKGIELTLVDPLHMTMNGEIMAQVVEQLRTVEYCIADISGGNPNVMIELGARLMTGKPCTIICEEGAEIPFNLKTQRILFYKPAGMIQLQTKLKQLMRENLREEKARALVPQPTITDVIETLQKLAAQSRAA